MTPERVLMVSYDEFSEQHLRPDALEYANAARDALQGIDPAGLTETDRLLYAVAAGVLSLAVSADRLDDRGAEIRTALDSKL